MWIWRALACSTSSRWGWRICQPSGVVHCCFWCSTDLPGVSWKALAEWTLKSVEPLKWTIVLIDPEIRPTPSIATHRSIVISESFKSTVHFPFLVYAWTCCRWIVSPSLSKASVISIESFNGPRLSIVDWTVWLCDDKIVGQVHHPSLRTVYGIPILVQSNKASSSLNRSDSGGSWTDKWVQNEIRWIAQCQD